MQKPAIQFVFNQGKAIEAILYIASKIPDPTYHSVSKLLYFADKASLEKYGRFVTGDTYCAMQYGPVPSNAYDLMKSSSSGDNGFRVVDHQKLVPLRQPDLDELSQSDIDVLDMVIDTYGSMDFEALTAISHDQAWEKAWQNRNTSKTAPMSVEDIAKLLKDGENLLEYLRTQHD